MAGQPEGSSGQQSTAMGPGALAADCGAAGGVLAEPATSLVGLAESGYSGGRAAVFRGQEGSPDSGIVSWRGHCCCSRADGSRSTGGTTVVCCGKTDHLSSGGVNCCSRTVGLLAHGEPAERPGTELGWGTAGRGTEMASPVQQNPSFGTTQAPRVLDQEGPTCISLSTIKSH